MSLNQEKRPLSSQVSPQCRVVTLRGDLKTHSAPDEVSGYVDDDNLCPALRVSYLAHYSTELWKLGRVESFHRKVTSSQSDKSLSIQEERKATIKYLSHTEGQKIHAHHIKRTDDKIIPQMSGRLL